MLHGRSTSMEQLHSIEQVNQFIREYDFSLLFLSSKNCGICTVILPKLEELTLKYPQLQAAQADINELPLLSGEFNVFTLPCVLVFVQGKEVLRQARYIDLQKIDQQIDRYITMLA